MPLSLDRFYRINQKLVIWLAFAGLLWVMKDFFHLVFVTFALLFLATPMVQKLQTLLKLPYKLSLIAVYAVFLLTVGLVVRFVAPNVLDEATVFASNLANLKERILVIREQTAAAHPNLHKAVRGYLKSSMDETTQKRFQDEMTALKKSLAIDDATLNAYLSSGQSLATGENPAASPGTSVDSVQALETYLNQYDDFLMEYHINKTLGLVKDKVPKVINLLYMILETFALSMLFSFLILIDKKALRHLVAGLEASRLRDFYLETAAPVKRLAQVVGKGIQAQAMIASLNTLLTLFGLLVLDIPSVAMLSMVVFVCGFIPVVGTFLSTAPIMLVALNTGGPLLALIALGLIMFIHMLEAYIFNPLIYGKHFELNPVVVILILFVGYHLFGIWGMILGVPLTQFLMQHVIGLQPTTPTTETPALTDGRS
jgi:predicted PurR-regulated permease PerM